SREEQRMEEMDDHNDPDSHEEKVTFWGQRFMKKDPRFLRSHDPGTGGCLTQVPLPLLLLVSLGLVFVFLVTTLVQVFRIHQALQSETWDHQNASPLLPVASPQKQIQLELEEIHQQLAWMNASLAGLCNPCSRNWESFQNSCYFLSRTRGTWDTSVTACQDQGAQLVIINSVEEQRFLQFWIVGKDTRTWIGLSDHHNEGAWHWVDNTKLQLSFWTEGEPNNVGDEDCAEMIAAGWNDNKCTAENFWVCEKPSTPCPGV
uniref:C-type lectin domain-containing protein n=1 Tax=Loxodonta africana TaxID=9785 RepID=G3TVS5_LOXAF